MRWTTKSKLPNVRTVVRFAWFPIDINGCKTIWLERYLSVERFVCVDADNDYWAVDAKWANDTKQYLDYKDIG